MYLLKTKLTSKQKALLKELLTRGYQETYLLKSSTENISYLKLITQIMKDITPDYEYKKQP